MTGTEVARRTPMQNVLAEVASVAGNGEARGRMSVAATFSEFLAALNVGGAARESTGFG